MQLFFSFIISILLLTNLALSCPVMRYIRTQEVKQIQVVEIKNNKTTYSNENELSKIRPDPYVYEQDIRNNDGFPESVFVVAGINSTEVVAKTPSIGGDSIELLNKRAHFGRGGGSLQILNGEITKDTPFLGLSRWGSRASSSGWLPEGTHLRDFLVKDNQTVVDQFKMSHREVVEPCLQGLEKIGVKGKSAQFKYKGENFEVSYGMVGGISFEEVMRMPSFDGSKPITPQKKYLDSGWIPVGKKQNNTQGSIFRDELFMHQMVIFKNTRTGETLTTDRLTIQSIFRYGWYQGGEFRNAPEKFIKFFHSDKTSKK